MSRPHTFFSSTFLVFALIISTLTYSTAIADCNPPIFTSTPALSINKNHCSIFTFDFNATEGGNIPAADPLAFSSTVGTINSATGVLSVPPLAACGSTSVTVTAANSCGLETNFSFDINWTNSTPSLWFPPTSSLVCPAGNEVHYDFNDIDADPCDPAFWTITALDPVVNPPSITGLGLFKWLSDSTEAGLTRHFEAIITDPCGGADTASFWVQVLDHVPQVFTIEHVHGGQMGEVEAVSIIRENGSAVLGGFDLLIAFDSRPLNFVSARPGSGIANCGWEYFTFEYIPSGYDCGNDCTGALVHITAIADINNIAGSPSCSQTGTELARLEFYVGRNLYYECQFLPIRFAWRDCSDNTAANTLGDTLWLSSRVFGFENTDPLNDPNYEITDTTCVPEVSFGGACSECPSSTAIRDIYFRNGGIDLACDGFPNFGDLNLNGIPFEIGDVIVYTNYFLYGLGALSPFMQDRVDQSDVNQDGTPLSIADFAYIFRVIVGDAMPILKLHPFESVAHIEALGGMISLESPEPVSALYLIFDVAGEVDVENHTDLQLNYFERDGQLHVLLYPGLENLRAHIPAGSRKLLTVAGAVLDSIQISDYNGNMMIPDLSRRVLPSKFQLAQNYPNPFNPMTRINLELPALSDWSLEIFNVTGQVIESFQGTDIGIISIDWDARTYPSGIYFYRATMGKYTETRKMVLLK